MGKKYLVQQKSLHIHGDSAYVIVEGPTWEEAEANANALGGHLVTINDADENEWIFKQFGTGRWIGLNDIEEEGKSRSSGEDLHMRIGIKD